MTLTRLKRSTAALGELRRATELDPESARYAYVYGVALHSGGQVEDAMVVLKDNLVRHPDNRDTLLALISYYRDAGDFKSALGNAEHLARISPGDRDLTNLIEDLRRRQNGLVREK